MSYKMIAASISRLGDYEGCPKRFKHTKLIKTHKTLPFAATSWGEEVHTALELNVKQGKVLPSYLQHMLPLIDGLRRTGSRLYSEMKVAIRRDFTPCGWWDADCWFRGMIDLVAINTDTMTAHAFDYKTGKRKTGRYYDETQLRIYGAALLVVLKLASVKSYYLWMKEPRGSDCITVDASNVDEIRASFTARVDAMTKAHADDDFPARTSPLCAWCPLIYDCDEAVTYRDKARFIKGSK